MPSCREVDSVKSSLIKMAGHIARLGERRDAYGV